MTFDTAPQDIERTVEQLDQKPTEADIRAEVGNLGRVAYDREREGLAKHYGIRTSTLDAIYKSTQGEADENGGDALEISDVEPYGEAVDGAALLDELEATFERYASLPTGGSAACALWALHSFAHDAATISPLLAITSATKRCGKSVLLRTVEGLTRRPLPAANITSAALFRSIEKWRPTLLIDEADTFLQESDELRGVLNSGHQKGGSVIRTVGDDHEPRMFSTWAAKAVALIGHLPATLADRSIEVQMQRRRPGEQFERLTAGQSFHPLPAKALRWANDHYLVLHTCDVEPPSSLNDRSADNWRPLLAIAETAGGDWPAKALAALHALEQEADESGVAVMLLADIKQLFDSREQDKVTSKGLAGYLETFEDRPWPEWKKGNSITPRQIAKLLEPFGIKPKDVRLDESVAKGYRCDQFDDVFSRYFPSQDATPLQPLQENGCSDFKNATPNNGVADRNSRDPLAHKRCSDVADHAPQTPKQQNREVL
ncbi:DUF3631 domain-containing protein [Salinisphaera orenii]|uniref:DUF3631 domain-containing protein n=1 Tax=Salinisphaera orenii TaxID=856731 RepID=UPI000DBE7B78